MKTRIKRLISLLCIVTVFAGAILSNQFLSAKAETSEEQLETLPTDMTEITFSDFGVPDGKQTMYKSGTYNGGDDLNNTLFGGRITFQALKKATSSNSLQYAGKVSAEGLNIRPTWNETEEKWQLRIFDSKDRKTIDRYLEEEIAGVNFVEEEFLLHISMRYVARDDDKLNDVELGLWFNEKLYDNQYFYLIDFVDADFSGKTMSFDTYTTGIDIRSHYPTPKGMTEISFRDFGFIDGSKLEDYDGEYDATTMHNTLFSGKITFPKRENVFLQYGGKVAGGGFNIGTAYDEEKGWYLRFFDTKYGGDAAPGNWERMFYSSDAGVELVGPELEFNISMEYVDADNDEETDDVKLGFWFGAGHKKNLYKNKYMYLYNFVNHSHSVGTWINFTSLGVGIKSVGEPNWKPLPTGMTEITFRDFGFIDGALESSYPYGEYDATTMHNTLFSGKITFPKRENVFLQYGGKAAYGGFNLGTAYSEENGWYLRLFDTQRKKGLPEINFYSRVADVELVGPELELNISMEYVDHDEVGGDDDVKIGVWFGGKLYNNNYIYFDNYVNNDHSVGTIMSFQSGTGVSIESVGTINWKELPTGMTEISFRDFGFIDGGLETGYPSGKYEATTMDNTMFIGKITFPERENVFLQYGGKVANGGFNIGTAYDKEKEEWYLRLFDTQRKKGLPEINLYADVAQVPLVGKEVALIITMQYVDHDEGGAKDDVKLGVWFGGKLYNNKYIYLDNYVNTNHSVGTIMSFYSGTGVNIKSVGEVKWKPLPTDFTQLTFSDYGIKAGVYEGGTKTGTCTMESMDRTLFSGIVNYSTVGETHFTFGGKGSLSGLDLVNVYNEKTGEHYIRLFDTNANNELKSRKFDMNLYSRVAGVTLVGEDLDLKISLEFVDYDADGAKDDLKLGIWFGGRLYNNRYIYVTDYVNLKHCIGNKLTIWNRNGSSFGVGRVSEWLDWSAFGLTANWKKTLLDTDFNLKYALAGGNPNTGDSKKYPYVTLISCLAVIVLCGYGVVRRRQKEDGIQQ